MRKMKRSFIIIFLWGFVICFANANVKLPRLFSDNLVLQREMRVPVWGWADPGEKVVVELGGHVAETAANSDGKWKLCLGPLDAGGPFELIISGKNSILLRMCWLVRFGFVPASQTWQWKCKVASMQNRR
jgi:sialate O-acetylesterase